MLKWRPPRRTNHERAVESVPPPRRDLVLGRRCSAARDAAEVPPGGRDLPCVHCACFPEYVVIAFNPFFPSWRCEMSLLVRVPFWLPPWPWPCSACSRPDGQCRRARLMGPGREPDCRGPYAGRLLDPSYDMTYQGGVTPITASRGAPDREAQFNGTSGYALVGRGLGSCDKQRDRLPQPQLRGRFHCLLPGIRLREQLPSRTIPLRRGLRRRGEMRLVCQ